MAKVKFDVYEEVTAQIIAALEKGVKPWECPWVSGVAGVPTRSNGEAYRGINNLLLGLKASVSGFRNPVWMTFKQAKDLGGMVRKGEKSSLVVKYGTYETANDAAESEDSKKKTRGYLKSYRVFNVEQIDGLGDQFSTPEETETFRTRPVEELSHIAANMIEGMGVAYAEGGYKAFYSPKFDQVQMPKIEHFQSAERFYSTLYHELCHATGHVKRCDRSKEKAGSKFGNAAYSQEELCAEIGAAFLGAQLGFEPGHIEDSAAYIASWLEVLRNDKRAIVRAAAAGQRAADYLMEAATAGEKEAAA
ncbi:ArdC family protein [Halocynthiibacter sp.]|uniref:ArdC family protein n=1 Tax=Halocynthiibacter sp. TaxID=1979210 RepID=UPI003C3AFADF